MSSYSSIYFHSEDTPFELKNSDSTIKWIEDTIKNEGKILGEVSYIFCSDEYLHKINLKHLNHDNYTDIITFNYCENNTISSDVFISIERVKDNANKFNTDFVTELHRVIIHGILHLVGYNDKSNEEQEIMTSKEDFYLSLRKD